jgi:putative two-component system response regulator
MTDEGLQTVLVVDDAETNVAYLVDVLSDDYDVSVAMDGPTALEEADLRPPDLILLDIIMPGMDGYEVCRRLKAHPVTCEIPVIFLSAVDQATAKSRGFEAGAVDYVTKPFNVAELQARVRTHLALRRATRALQRQNDILEEMVIARTREIELTRDVTFHALATLVDCRSPETGAHIHRTRAYVQALAQRLCGDPGYPALMDLEYVQLLHKASPLHDIGKVGVPDHILLKPGRLSPDEFDVIKQHTTFGRDALLLPEAELGTSRFLGVARELIYSHHERWDGGGYPEGLRGDAIPLPGRLMALADVYDALISARVYKPAIPHEEALEIMEQGIGTHFDPNLGDTFMRCHEEFRAIAARHADAPATEAPGRGV